MHQSLRKLSLFSAAFALMAFGTLQAQFSGIYAPSNWTVTQVAGGNGSVNSNSAPTSIALTGPDNVTANAYTRYEIDVIAPGTISFDWSVNHNDPTYDGFGYWLNNTYTELANTTTSGSSTVPVTAGQTFAFYGHTYDGCCGTFTSTITNFSGPSFSAPNDAGISSLNTPVEGFCADTIPISVTVKNYGSNQISPVTIEWTLNGTAQTPFTYTGTLDTNGGSGADSAILIIDNVYLEDSNDIVLWTTDPNNATDTVNHNDSASLSFYAAHPEIDLGDTSMCEGLIMILNAGSGWDEYLWSDSSVFQQLLVTSGGTFSVTVTDEYGCEASDEVIVTEVPLPVVSLGDSIEACDILVLDAGNAGSTFNWNTFENTQTITVTQSGNYSCLVINTAGCVGQGEVEVTIHESPSINLGSDFELCVDLNETDSLGVSGSYAMYAWSNGDTSSTVLVGGTGTSTGTVEYVLTATDANGCSDEDTIEVKFKNCIPQGLTEVELGIQTTVYPNPTTGVTQIKIVGSSQSELGISLVDLTGRRVQNVYQGATPGILQFEVDFTRITSGMYFLLTNNGAAVESIPIIIE